jgi:ketosteroid isomerase-like protein
MNTVRDRSSRSRRLADRPPTPIACGAGVADHGRRDQGREPMSQIRQTLERICDAFNAHDLDRIMSFFTDDCVLEMPRGNQPWGARFEGRENVRKALAGRFEGLPDVHYGDGQHFVDDATNSGMSKWTLTGTRRDGQWIEVWGCDFYTFRDGKVTRKDSYWKIVE